MSDKKLKIEFNSKNFTKPLKAIRESPMGLIFTPKFSKIWKEKEIFTPEEVMYITGATDWIDICKIQEIGDDFIVIYAKSIEIENNNNIIIFKDGCKTFAIIRIKNIKKASCE